MIATTGLAAAVLLSVAGCGKSLKDLEGRDSPRTPTASAASGGAPEAGRTGGTSGNVPSVPSVPTLPTPTRNPTGPAPSVPPSAPVDGRDAIAVSKAAATTMWTVDTGVDTSLRDATLRAAPYLDPAYLADQQAGTPISAPGAEWLTWAEHRAVTRVVATLADDMGKPDDTPVKAWHAWSLRVTPSGPDGWQGTPVTVVVFVSLARSGPDQPWKVVEAADSRP